MKGKFPNGLKAAMETAGIGQTELARLAETNKQNILRWADGERRLPPEWAEKLAPLLSTRPEALIFPADDVVSSRVPIMGLIGAGGSIDTKVSQAYGDGNVHEIVLDIPVPYGVSAWEVWGPSMMPKYDPGDVILIQRAADPIDLLLGQVALVVTEDGRRMLKRILRGSEPGLYNLESFNAPTMEDQHVVEAGAIYVVVPMNQVQRPAGPKEVARRYERKAVA